MDDDALRAHRESCPDCRRLHRLHELLKREAAPAVLPTEERFERMRAAVRKRILAEPRRRALRPRFPAFVFVPGLRAAAAAGLLLTVGAAGFLAGRWTSARAESIQTRLASELRREAGRGGHPSGIGDSGYRLGNVSLRELRDGRLDMEFDVTTRLRLQERPDVPLVRDALVQSLLNADSPGLRIKAVYDLENLPRREAVEALIFTLGNDPVPTVRRSAFDILASLPADPAIAAAMLRTLEEDPDVEMRLRALDCLAGRKADPALLRQAIETGPADSRPALLVRAKRLLPS